ncbi:hypothetical protein OG564_45565 [Streptomyces sp. NBC_01280]|uniref:hypothetical protein n=1 Tax=unclassified Streptomyces TaxID=2593676 RepID=UPI002E338B64|nr:hypothetical protein [Streptomyces sp. NBC_01280]WSE11965.1 hypothetical protein OG518_00640 [Streptomyces sp. NBC_01397]WSE19661.1 hypothetical protein OG518_43800 [Streptomyces sp. NBC_01397]
MLQTTTRRRAARATAAVFCALALALSQAGLAAAAEKKVSFAFKYRMDTSTWKQKRGKVSILFTKCRAQRSFHALLVRERFGQDTKLEGHTLTCRVGQRAYFDAPDNGTYYFTLTKADDNEYITGNATLSFPAP